MGRDAAAPPAGQRVHADKSGGGGWGGGLMQDKESGLEPTAMDQQGPGGHSALDLLTIQVVWVREPGLILFVKGGRNLAHTHTHTRKCDTQKCDTQQCVEGLHYMLIHPSLQSVSSEISECPWR